MLAFGHDLAACLLFKRVPMQAQKPAKPSAVTVRRAYKTPQLARFGALRELTLGPKSMLGQCDNVSPCDPGDPKTS
jgi:hypothetical protein